MAQELSPSTLSTEQIADLRRRASKAAEHAYSPYSKFRVGSAVLMDDGSVFTGCNIENASYRMTICAEHTAIAKAVSDGSKARIVAIAVANLNDAGSMPCGPCRQVILEFGSPDTWVFGPGNNGEEVSIRLADLLPHSFSLEIG